MRYHLFTPVLLAATALAVPNDVIGDAGVAVNVGGDKAVGVLDHKRDVIQDLGVAANVGGDKTVDGDKTIDDDKTVHGDKTVGGDK
ncbi:unnamed protein product [Penicillium viridicatum]